MFCVTPETNWNHKIYRGRPSCKIWTKVGRENRNVSKYKKEEEVDFCNRKPWRKQYGSLHCATGAVPSGRNGAQTEFGSYFLSFISERRGSNCQRSRPDRDGNLENQTHVMIKKKPRLLLNWLTVPDYKVKVLKVKLNAKTLCCGEIF